MNQLYGQVIKSMILFGVVIRYHPLPGSPATCYNRIRRPTLCNVVTYKQAASTREAS